MRPRLRFDDALSLPPRLPGIFLLSLSGLLFQLAATRIASAALNYHLAFFIISAALLGTGAGGAWVAMRRHDVPLWPLAVGSAFGIAAVGAAAFWLPLRLADSAAVLMGLILIYPVLALPFFCQGAAIASLLRAAGRRSGITYAAVLLGAAVGVGLSPIVLDVVGPPWTLVVACCASVVAASSFGLAGRWWLLGALVPCVAMATIAIQPFAPNVLRTKPLATLLDPVLFPDAQLLTTTWDSTSRVDVIEAPGAPLLWGTRGAGLVGLPGGPEARGITIDADALTAVLRAEGGESADVVFNLATSAPHALAPRERVLVIGSGGGVDVEAALAFGARHVDAVEINRGVVDAMLGPLAVYTGDLYRRMGVSLAVGDGRSFVRRAGRGTAYDAIVLTAVDSWAAIGAGAYSLTENYLYTAEAFQEYYDLLAPGGVLAVSRWYTTPPRELARLTQMAARAIERRGENPARSLLLIRSGQFGSFGTLLVRKGAFPTQEVVSARAFVRAKGFGLAYDPVLNAASFGDLYLDDFPIDAPPARLGLATDDQPFFFAFTRWGDVFRGRIPYSQLPLGHSVLLVTLIQSAAFALVVTVLPFRRFRARRRTSG
ncbi:MAG TPA: hypothetical protein VGW38_06445, partial [Chloroflexota bacterium]|nr:hypothetical protein [Chloroflexota bacterium]